MFNYPSRIDLARTPTPVEPVTRLGFSAEVLVKRDDLTGFELSGNKVRKLEFLFAEALVQGKTKVITCGGEQSNHCRATALAAARLGLGCKLLLRTADPARPPPTDGNILLDRLAGAEIVWITPEQYRGRRELLAREADGAYVIPEGGSNAIGSWGYVRAVEELAPILTPGTTLVYACGSGGTGAGILLGVKLLGLDVRTVGFAVSNDRAYFVSTIGAILDDAVARYGLSISFDRERDIEILDGYVGPGYALSYPEELRLIREVARKQGLLLDPVYTGKAFYGMTQELPRLGQRIVFLHTGGVFGLFTKTAELIEGEP